MLRATLQFCAPLVLAAVPGLGEEDAGALSQAVAVLDCREQAHHERVAVGGGVGALVRYAPQHVPHAHKRLEVWHATKARVVEQGKDVL